MKRAGNDRDQSGRIEVGTERDLRGSMREICRRFNADPMLSRLLMVNPIYAFEDAGVVLSPAMRQRVMEALRFPPKLKEQIARLEQELGEELEQLGEDCTLPLDGARRANLLFRTLKVEPKPDHDEWEISPATLRTYARDHPLAAKLAEYERARQGGLPFQPRKVYDAYKAGDQKHRWIRVVSFKI
ncbi:MAG: hypothetical protein ABIW83_02765 [Allosphingosinicella sp.]